MEKQSWRNSTFERTCDISDLVAACIYSVHIFRMQAIGIFVLVALLLRLLAFSQIKWPVSAKSASDTVKQREEQQAKQQRLLLAALMLAALLLAALMCYTHASRLNKDGHLTFPSRRPWQVAATRQSARLTPAVQPRPR